MKKKIKVLVDIYHLQDSISGLRTYTTELINGIQEFGDDNIEYTFSHDPGGKLISSRPSNHSNILKKLWNHFMYFLWKQVFLPFIILWRKPDYLITTDFVAPAWNLTCKNLTVIHDALFWQYPENYNSTWRKYYIKMISLGLNKNSEIVTTSEHAAKQIRKYVTRKLPITFIYQNFNENKNCEDSILEKLELKPLNYLLHVGSFDKRKDLMTLLKAFHSLKSKDSNKNFKLVLAGEKKVHGNSFVYKEILSYASFHELEQSVLMPGYLSKAEINSLYSNASAYVFPSVEEGFGIPILESFHSGLPVITSNNPALLEVGGSAISSFDVGDSEILTEKIEDILNSKELSAHYRNKGFKRLNFFSRKSYVKDFEKLILHPSKSSKEIKVYNARTL